MDNKENILDELTNFEKRKPKEIPQILEDYLIRIAKTGDTMFPWTKLKPLFMFKMERVISEFHENSPTDDLIPCPNMERFKFDAMKEKLLEAIDNFSSSAPFTIQRLCELITSPRKHYKHTEKFMRGLEKNVLVVSTVEPGCSHIFACDCARKRSDHNSALMNGILDTPTAHNGVDNENNNGEFISKEISISPSIDTNSEFTDSGQQMSPEIKSTSDEDKLDIADTEMKNTELKNANMNGSQEAMDTCPSEDDEPLLSAEVDESFVSKEDEPFVAKVEDPFTPKVDESYTAKVDQPFVPKVEEVETDVKPSLSAELKAEISNEVGTSIQNEKENVNESTEMLTVTEEAASTKTDTAKEINDNILPAVDEEKAQEPGSCNSDNTVSSSTHSPSSTVTTVAVSTATSEAKSAPVADESNREASHLTDAEEALTDEVDTITEAGGDASNMKAEKVDDGVDSSSIDSQRVSTNEGVKREVNFHEGLPESAEVRSCDTRESEEVQTATSSDNDTDAVETAEATGSDQQLEASAEECTAVSKKQLKSSEAEQPSSSDVSDENKISASSEMTVAPTEVKEEEEESMVTTTPTEEATSTPSLTTSDVVMEAPSLEEATSAEDSSSLPLQAESSSSSSSSSSPSPSSLSPQHISTSEVDDSTSEVNIADSSPTDGPNQASNTDVAVDESEPMEQD